jgi:chromosome segregation ATPase
MSSGQRLLSSLAELQNIREPRVILLDEPELALDFNAVNAFCGMIIKQSATQQFLVATHHPLMMAMPNTNFVVFGADKKYPRNALARMRKVLASSKL